MTKRTFTPIANQAMRDYFCLSAEQKKNVMAEALKWFEEEKKNIRCLIHAESLRPIIEIICEELGYI